MKTENQVPTFATATETAVWPDSVAPKPPSSVIGWDEDDDTAVMAFFDTVYSGTADRLYEALKEDLSHAQVFNAEDFDTFFDCTFEHVFEELGISFNAATNNADGYVNVFNDATAAIGYAYTSLYYYLRSSIVQGLNEAYIEGATNPPTAMVATAPRSNTYH